MNDFFVANFTKPPKGKKAVTNQIGFCLITALIILFVVSKLVTSVYVSALQSQRKTALTSYTSSVSVALSYRKVENGMKIPLDIPKDGENPKYTVNVFLKAGNSFLRVYTSDKSYDESKEYVLSGVGEEYAEAYDKQELIVSHRTDNGIYYITSIAPIINTDGTISGIVEVMQPQSTFISTVNGMSLSWVFTIISIAVAIALIYGEMRRLLDTLISQPDKRVPKIISYGFSTFRLIAFFSSIGCTMAFVVLASYIKDSLKETVTDNVILQMWIVLAALLFLVGFWRFVHIRDLLIRKFTARIAVVISVVSAFVLLLLCGVADIPFLTIFMQLPIGFFLGMLFQFQRDYRLFASKSGQGEFSETRIHQCQYSGYILGSAVGAVIAGILYERFGLFAVLMVASFFLFVDAIQVLYFVRHCPPSNEPILRLPNFFYALKNSKSGTFVWSAVFPMGVQFAFFFVFIPDYLEKVRISLATLSFYYMVSIVCGQIILKILMIWFEDFFTAKTRITLACVFSSVGYLVFALYPSAKSLVICTALLGFSLGLHEFGYLEYYKSLIRHDKHPIARVILMRAFTGGVLIGAIVFGCVNLLDNIRIPMIAVAILSFVVSASYPLLMLMDNSSQNQNRRGTPNRRPPQQDSRNEEV